MATTQPIRSILRGQAAQALVQDLGWHARQCARLLTAELDRQLAASELSSTQFGLMCLIATSPDDTVGALAERAGLNQSTMSRNIDALARAGWVEVATAVEDRRRRSLWLTEAGLRRLHAAMPLWQAAHAQISARLHPELVSQLLRANAVMATPPFNPPPEET